MNIKEIILHCYRELRKSGYRGYDPYDCLNSSLTRILPGKYLKIASTQFLVYSPVNLRSLLGIKKGINPKSMGLILSSLSMLKRLEDSEIDRETSSDDIKVARWIMENHIKSYSGPCWGYHFPWQDLDKYIPRNQPSIVVSSFIGHSLLDHYEIHRDESIGPFVRGICDFIVKDLNIYRDGNGICFSYSPFDRNVVHNANLLGASFLLRYSEMFSDNRYLDSAVEAYEFTLSYQNPDGSWFYSMDTNGKGGGRKQFDFHQGFVIDSLLLYHRFNDEKRVEKAISRGAEFYRRSFRNDEVSYFRYPRKWPVDIHNQAQGIITFSKLSSMNGKFKRTHDRILKWTLDNMLLKNGDFIHQKWPMISNRIQYSRWNRSWMLNALSHSLIMKDA